MKIRMSYRNETKTCYRFERRDDAGNLITLYGKRRYYAGRRHTNFICGQGVILITAQASMSTSELREVLQSLYLQYFI